MCERDAENEPAESTVTSPSSESNTPTFSSFDVSQLVQTDMITDSLRSQWIDSCFRPPEGYSFPPRNGRSRLPSWFSKFLWLRYSPKENGCFCLPCVLFRKSNSNRGQLVSAPLTNFHKGASALTRHSKQKSHLLAMADLSHYLSVRDHLAPSVEAQLHSVDAERRQKNRSKLAAICLRCFAPWSPKH